MKGEKENEIKNGRKEEGENGDGRGGK